MKTSTFAALLTLNCVTHSCARLSPSSSDSPRGLSNNVTSCKDDDGFEDMFGNNCVWYHEGRFRSPSRCEQVGSMLDSDDPLHPAGDNGCCICKHPEEGTTFPNLEDYFDTKVWQIQGLKSKRYLGTDAGDMMSGQYIFNQFPNVAAGFTIAHNTWIVSDDLCNDELPLDQPMSGFSIGGQFNTFVLGGFCPSGEVISGCNQMTTTYLGVNPFTPFFCNYPFPGPNALNVRDAHFEFESLGTTGVVRIKNYGLQMRHALIADAVGLDPSSEFYLHDLGDGNVQFHPETPDRNRDSESAAFLMVEVPCPASGGFF